MMVNGLHIVYQRWKIIKPLDSLFAYDFI